MKKKTQNGDDASGKNEAEIWNAFKPISIT